MALPTAAYRWRGLWVNGQNYYNYDMAQSPLDNLTYVLDNGNQLLNSVLDPSLDPLWKLISSGGGATYPVQLGTMTSPVAIGNNVITFGGALGGTPILPGALYRIEFNVKLEQNIAPTLTPQVLFNILAANPPPPFVSPDNVGFSAVVPVYQTPSYSIFSVSGLLSTSAGVPSALQGVLALDTALTSATYTGVTIQRIL